MYDHDHAYEIKQFEALLRTTSDLSALVRQVTNEKASYEALRDDFGLSKKQEAQLALINAKHESLRTHLSQQYATFNESAIAAVGKDNATFAQAYEARDNAQRLLDQLTPSSRATQAEETAEPDDFEFDEFFAKQNTKPQNNGSSQSSRRKGDPPKTEGSGTPGKLNPKNQYATPAVVEQMRIANLEKALELKFAKAEATLTQEDLDDAVAAKQAYVEAIHGRSGKVTQSDEAKLGAVQHRLRKLQLDQANAALRDSGFTIGGALKEAEAVAANGAGKLTQEQHIERATRSKETTETLRQSLHDSSTKASIADRRKAWQNIAKTQEMKH